MMQAPRFWSNPPGAPGLLARLLTPLGWLYGASVARRLRRGAHWRAPVPVICVGNLVAGGAGKTPAVIALQERLTARGIAAHVVTRGHGGTEPGPHRVDIARDAAAQVGDEALLVGSYGPVWVARDRAAGAKAAVAAGAEAILLDDGHQNPGLAKDLSLLVVDAEAGFGNGRMIPAGPLREPVAVGLSRADAVLAVGPAAARRRLLADWPALAEKQVLAAEIVAKETGMDWKGLRVVAFAGIGRPEKFFATLRGLGADLVAAHGFPDHAPYAPRALARLQAEAARLNGQLVTTEKDAARLPRAFHGMALPLPVELRLEDEDALDRLLDGVGLG
jgi:tetraacyldisaccharide 4'-kinase